MSKTSTQQIRLRLSGEFPVGIKRQWVEEMIAVKIGYWDKMSSENPLKRKKNIHLEVETFSMKETNE